MTKITDLSELKDGDIVYLFGEPFTDEVAMWNPFAVEEPELRGRNWFRSLVNDNIQQTCSYLRKDTYIFKGELTVEDEAELILEGLINE